MSWYLRLMIITLMSMLLLNGGLKLFGLINKFDAVYFIPALFVSWGITSFYFAKSTEWKLIPLIIGIVYLGVGINLYIFINALRLDF